MNSATQPTPSRCRVAIIGGGPAGSAAALALAGTGVDGVQLIEAGDYSRQRVGESLPPDTRLLLARLGLWDSFRQQRHDPCLGSCSAWGSDDLGYNDFLSNPQGHGWHLDRRRFERWLADEAQARGVELRTQTRLSAVETNGDGYRLELRSPAPHSEYLHADYVIDASGAHARFARLVGARAIELDQLICIYGFFSSPAQATNSRLTLLEAAEYGWWYRAALPDGQLCIALACDQPGLRQLKAGEWRNWLNLLADTRHTASNLQGYGFEPGSMLTSPASSYRLDQVVGSRWLAAGDAASSFDPLMARGIHKALEDGIAAAEAIVGWLNDDTTAAERHARQIEQRYQEFREMRRYLYAQEQRWPQSSFWQARQLRT
ncbi:FAD-dependent oxidoreductase [Pseudomonas sp.]|uniref:FAD-dependent oxidoreductase n=1 Tax=Pseudomonas sp. TaxID=306 RepID=UPI00299DFC2C|nr:FAD-dependent oxidoreductase [Pseudomonas sp.]MDX1366741.1 FAD-dependent oxidoreductase [Pseudomonas sp.]